MSSVLRSPSASGTDEARRHGRFGIARPTALDGEEVRGEPFSLDAVAAKLEAREGRSGIEEKAARPK